MNPLIAANERAEVACSKSQLNVTAVAEKHDALHPLLGQEPSGEGYRASVRQLVTKNAAVEAMRLSRGFRCGFGANDRVSAMFEHICQRPSHRTTWFNDENLSRHNLHV
jgi:hypothetical protein